MKPLIIIGAARSGTNMLRDILSQLPNYGTWDCDEINPIWRHGNIDFPHDIFPANLARPEVSTFIRNEFNSISKHLGVENVIEKSCANSLRLPFINQIFPEAKYIFIYRDGRDTVVSAKDRWTAKFDLSYSLKKLRYVPLSDIWHYGWSFGKARLKQLFASEKKLEFWGVRLPNMQQLVSENTLEEVCALQWDACIKESSLFFENVPQEKYVNVRYEDFVTNPKSELDKILSFLGVEGLTEIDKQNLIKGVKVSSVGTYKRKTPSETLEKIEKIMLGSLKKLHYA